MELVFSMKVVSLVSNKTVDLRPRAFLAAVYRYQWLSYISPCYASVRMRKRRHVCYRDSGSTRAIQVLKRA